MRKYTWLAFGILLAIPLLLAGCEEVKCDPCIYCTGVEVGEECTPGCPSFLGEYYGTIESLNETCADVILLTGDDYMNVISQNPLRFEARDSQGRWSVFDGTLCFSTEEDPKNFPFNAYYTPDTSDRDYDLTYSLIGFFTGEYGVEAANVTATLDLNFRFDDGEICNLKGDIRLSRSQGL